MPWTETCPVKERKRFVLDHRSGLWTMTELCERYGISRKTGYKVLERVEAEGVAGLEDRSRRPRSSPEKTPDFVEHRIIEVRKAHPTWGARKILSYLGRRQPWIALPARSTVCDILSRNGLVTPRRRRRKWAHPGRPALETTEANDVWTADFKGQFRTRDGVYCYPLTIADHFSRFLLRCQGLGSVKTLEARPVFLQLFREVGLPLAIRTDNGAPFASRAIHGLCALKVWWIQLGIEHQRIEPASPGQNGAHERMHRTLKAEATRPPRANRRAQQRAFNKFRCEYNEERPHEALDDDVPADRWAPSPRPYPEKIEGPDYPGHYLPRRVCNAGTFRFKGTLVFISQALKGLHIALEEVEDGVWSIYFCDVLLARLDERTMKLHP